MRGRGPSESGVRLGHDPRSRRHRRRRRTRPYSRPAIGRPAAERQTLARQREANSMTNHVNDRAMPGPNNLAEYTAAQESAQHHDGLIWRTTGVVWAGNFVLLGFVVSTIAAGRGGPFVVVASLLGLLLTAGVWRAVVIWNRVINAK